MTGRYGLRSSIGTGSGYWWSEVVVWWEGASLKGLDPTRGRLPKDLDSGGREVDDELEKKRLFWQFD
ncbi:unnamed protein product [Linum trigynum]|uniref:Uncharacterized protein n=1 Tax=Linum trigynum TaxID=586398 RepID=A0AAV2GJL1_9ROSI